MKIKKNNVPAKPVIQLSFFCDEYLYVCPHCCYDIGYTNNLRVLRVKSCPNCGQLLDWSDIKNEM